MSRSKPYISLPPLQRRAARIRAAQLFAVDVPTADVARMVHATTVAVWHWRKVYTQGGPQALANLPGVGAKPVLSGEFVDKLITQLEKRPSQHGLEVRGDVWTWEAITRLASDLAGHDLVRQTVQRALRRQGWELP